ncbi:MAG: GDP-L-fucose synthetase, partial [uncultured Thermoleophilia bacterium]
DRAARADERGLRPGQDRRRTPVRLDLRRPGRPPLPHDPAVQPLRA